MAKATMFIANMPITATPRTMSSVAMRAAACGGGGRGGVIAARPDAARSVIGFPSPDGERRINHALFRINCDSASEGFGMSANHARLAHHRASCSPVRRRSRSRAAGTRCAAGETLPRACGPARLRRTDARGRPGAAAGPGACIWSRRPPFCASAGSTRVWTPTAARAATKGSSARATDAAALFLRRLALQLDVILQAHPLDHARTGFRGSRYAPPRSPGSGRRARG